jgi:hypothetical protein
MILTTIFYHVDNFCKELEKFLRVKTLSENKKQAGRKAQLTKSEIMTIMIYFHHSRMRTFKDYYTILVKGLMRQAFPGLVSYNRFWDGFMDSSFILLLMSMERLFLLH